MNYFEMYKDVWEFHKKYIDRITDTDEFWKAVVDDSDKIYMKYGKCKFIVNLVLGEMAEFERIYKEMKDADTGV